MDNPKYDRIREYLNGKRDPKTDEEIREWLCREPLHDEAEQALRDFWKQLPEESDLPQSRAAFDDFCRNIGSFGEPRRPWAVRWGRRVRNIAAMLLIPAAALCVLLLQRPAASDVEWCEFAVAQGHTDSLTLPDNSRVWLNAGSHLIYPRSFDGRIRKVFLSGRSLSLVAQRWVLFQQSASERDRRAVRTCFQREDLHRGPPGGRDPLHAGLRQR